MSTALFVAYVAPLALTWAVYVGLRSRTQRAALAVREEAIAAGLTEPTSLHPVIDPERCLGCGACTRACPEGGVLGLIDGRATLVEPTNCIGHGACKQACPFDAISLVFGTAKRGVDIPEVGPDFQTNVPGVFIAGELGGMGLIRNAVTQGQQAIEGVRTHAASVKHPEADLVIIGAGPAGLAAGLAAKANGLRFVIVEQETFGGTVAHFPRGKLVMTQPVQLPLVGKMHFREVSKERLLSFWASVLQRVHLPITYGERLLGIERDADGVVIRTTHGIRRSATLLLAIGRRGTPRKLGVPGEDRSKVVYRVSDPLEYRGRRVLVVGGGDSALEAAATIAEEAGAKVTLSYRSKAFSRAKPKNRVRVEELAKRGRIDLKLGTQVVEVLEDEVMLEEQGRRSALANDAVVVCAGGLLPTGLLREAGIKVETKHGTA